MARTTRPMRQGWWLVVGVVLIGASLVQAAELELITPPLFGSAVWCIVTNVSDEPRSMIVEILTADGEVNAAAGTGFPPLIVSPLHTSWLGLGGLSTARICWVTSDEAKKGDLLVTFCIRSTTGDCQAAVTAQ